MKAKFLPFLLLAVLLQLNMFSYAREMKSLRQIKLSNTTKVEHRSIPISPIAFVESPMVSIDLLSPVNTVTIIIKDAETEEVVYTSTNLNVEKLNINLIGEKKGKYVLEIQLPTNTFTGEFELD
ncbi:DUF3244 domain-containing protein [uncultured Bacteroides sp.]|uniref:DUF3244 domain-containing protein n=1 Tax=uncultured Bacteroides sp. TaxID=162156 RepID=UPI00280BE1EF|nr:DUF3244 domain-containing protein [uncultured Bacteroides sp.]